MSRSGLLLVDKARGITSHDVVDLFRRRTKIRRVGHTGTLDPMATGLLVLCVGRTTRLQSYLMKTEKTYEGTIRFGWATDSYDATGTPAGEQVERSVEGIDLAPVIEEFRGEIQQMPPSFSAKKVGGVRAYELARKGEVPVLEAKTVHVYAYEILSVEQSRVRFRVRCSAGTYVRSLAHELGQRIGIPSHLEQLVRTTVGKASLKDAISSDAIAGAGEELFSAPHFQSLAEVELPMPSVHVDPAQQGKLQNGQNVVVKPMSEAEITEGAIVAVRNLDGELFGLGEAVRVLRSGGGPVEIQPRVIL